MNTGESPESRLEALPESRGALPEMPFGDAREPGCYLATESGRLLRLTAELLSSAERFPTCPPDTWSARLSENPQETLAVLREIAGRNGYFVNF